MQSPPKKSEHPAIWPLVIADVAHLKYTHANVEQIKDVLRADMEKRHQHGLEHYGQPLQPHNGRDGALDAYEEALDLCAYARQMMEETQHPVWAMIAGQAIGTAAAICAWRMSQ